MKNKPPISPHSSHDRETRIWRLLFFFILLVVASLFVAMAFNACTTVRPLTIKEVAVAQAKRIHDTLERQQINHYITNPEKLVPVPGRRDTIFSVLETRTERVPYFDSTKIDPYLQEAVRPLLGQISTLQATVNYLLSQRKSGSDSVRAITAKLDTTVKQGQANAAIANATKTVFDGAFYLYILFIAIVAWIYLRYRYLVRRLARKKADVLIKKT